MIEDLRAEPLTSGEWYNTIHDIKRANAPPAAMADAEWDGLLATLMSHLGGSWNERPLAQITLPETYRGGTQQLN